MQVFSPKLWMKYLTVGLLITSLKMLWIQKKSYIIWAEFSSSIFFFLVIVLAEMFSSIRWTEKTSLLED